MARTILAQETDGARTLGDLARRVGLNRSKLAFGFKQIYGVPARKFWRDANLDRAYVLLQEEGAQVTDVAFDLGYSDRTAFSRAFARKFGVFPRDCKKSG